jgi:hypothetical protein
VDEAKPFDIPKREVWEAFKKVKEVAAWGLRNGTTWLGDGKSGSLPQGGTVAGDAVASDLGNPPQYRALSWQQTPTRGPRYVRSPLRTRSKPFPQPPR